MKASPSQRFPLYGGFLASGMVASALSALLPSVRSALSLDYFRSSFILTGDFLGMFAAVAISGLVADRIGKRPFMIAGGAVMALGLLLAALSPGYGLLLAGIVVCGVGFGFWSTAINALCADMSDAGSSGGAMGFLHFFFGLGAILGPVLVKLCAGAGIWQASFAFLAILPAAVSSFVLSRGVSWPRHHPDAPKAPSRMGGSSWVFLAVAGAALVSYVATELSGYGWIPAWWEDRGPDAAAWLRALVSPEISATLFWAFLTLGRLVLPPLSNKMGPGPFSIASSLTGLGAALLWALLPSPAAGLAAACLLAFSISSIYPTVMAWANAAFPGRTGMVSSLLSVFASLPGLFAPGIVGGVADRRGIGILPWALVATSSAMLAFLAATAVLRRLASHGKAAPAIERMEP